jgi:SAM-dependent methyltransferase
MQLQRQRKRRAFALYDRLADGQLSRQARGANALDIGCGAGALLDVIAEHGYNGEGIERSSELARRAGERHTVHAADVERDADLGRRYRLVTMTHVLEHLERPVQALRFIAHHLEEEGLAVLEVPNWGDLARPFWGTRYRPLELGDHVSFFERPTLTHAIERAGLGVRRMWSQPQGATLVMPSVLSAADMLVRWRRARSDPSSSAGGVGGDGSPPLADVSSARWGPSFPGARGGAGGRHLGGRWRSRVLGALDRLDPWLERVGGERAWWGANLVAIVGRGS